MKQFIILALACFFLLPVEGCSAQKKRRKKKRKVTRVTTRTTTTTPANVLVVSFISFGSGIDYKAIPEFETDLKTFNKENACAITYESRNWGREGERDYCITSKSPSCLDLYVSHIKKVFSGHDRILIKENAPCKH